MDNRLKSPLNNPSGSAPQPALSRAIQERLGRELQRDPVTGHLADLLSQLERKDPTSAGWASWRRGTAQQAPVAQKVGCHVFHPPPVQVHCGVESSHGVVVELGRQLLQGRLYLREAVQCRPANNRGKDVARAEVPVVLEQGEFIF